jgi:transcription-repair coupling factor (superfamily II helicase)
MKFFDNIFNILDNNCYGVTGLNKELNCIYVYETFIKKNKGLLVVTNSLFEANDMFQRIGNYTDRVLLFPMDDFITSEALAISPEFKSERINTLNKLVLDNKYIVVVNLMGLLRYLPSKKLWKNSIIKLAKNQDINRDNLIKLLVSIGYERETIVTETGKMGIRGYVLDIFPIGEDNPIRIEFWGDTIDSIKYFDVDTQLTIEEIDELIINPFTEFIVETEDIDIVRKQKYLKNYSDDVSSLGNYLDDYLCFYNDYNQILSAYRLLRENILEYKSINDEEFDTDYMFDIDDIRFNNYVYLMNVDNVLENVKLNECERYLCNSIDNYRSNIDLFRKDLDRYLNAGKTVLLCIPDKSDAKRVVKYLEREDIVIATELDIIKNKINLINRSIGNGFSYDDYVIIGSNDIFERNDSRKMYVSSYKLGTKVSSIDNISLGDYVVHETFGIGIYDELCTLKKNGILKDYIKLKYADGDCLYIPVEKIDRISKFAGREGAGVKLDKLGTDNWKKKKSKVRGRLEDIAANLIKVSAEREAMKGYAFSLDDENQIMFDSEFSFMETPDQIKAIKAIKKEMEQSKPMDMLLCGDVGYGKTEVAFRAMFKAVNDGKQVAYLCPTTVLSNQQYKNAIERFKSFPVRIALLNRFVDRKKQLEIIDDVNNGKVDILFGTHRILSKDIKFKDLGLLVIDEEQRFGVTHKEKIKQYKANVDVLTLSATPIPRTLQMSMTGIRSLSLIETPPKERFPIQTYVLPENKNVIKDAIYKELSRNGQVFLLYNSVENIVDKVRELKELIPEARIDYAHGQMTKDTLENKMQDFIDYKYDILVCTTIIETGIDIPNVNTLIIVDADRFGLSQLYQIRGRIGRSNKVGYAYLMYNKNKVLNDIAVKRLNTIKEFTELGSGFKIAMRDLSIRGAGDILGRDQSGFIDTIGIDLYLKMLKEAVNKVKGNIDVVEQDELKDDNKSLIEVDTHISNDYIDDTELKIEIHKKINEIDSFEKLVEVKSILEDRFGKVTDEMEIYMYEEWFEKLANSLGIVNVKQTKTFIELELPLEMSSRIDGEKLFMMAYGISNNFRFSYKLEHIYVTLDIVNLDKHFLIYLVEFLDKLEKEVIKGE